MRTLVIGDIHGCTTALDRLLNELAPGAEDTLITLGDYVDRGPDSRGVLDRLIALESMTQLVPLMGNHEILMLDARDRTVDFGAWMAVGGRATMESYAPEVTMNWKVVPDAHWDFMKNKCRRLHETETHIFVHAGVNAMLPLSEQSDDWLFWRRFDDAHPHFSGKQTVCGHTAQKNGLPGIKPGVTCIDTWVYGEGWLTAMDVSSATFFQANQRGELRTLTLEEVLAAQPPGAGP